MLVSAEGVAKAGARCPVSVPDGVARLAEIDGRERLDWIDGRLTSVARQARIWTWGWGGGIGLSGVASLAVVPFVSPGDRVDWYTSAGSAAIGVVPFIVSPLDVMRDARELHAGVTNARRTAPHGQLAAGEVCTLLADAEQRLVRDAEDQRFQQSAWLHVGNVAFNTGVMLFLGLGFHHWSSGIINGAAGAVVGETLLFTQPLGTVKDLQVYRTAAFQTSF